MSRKILAAAFCALAAITAAVAGEAPATPQAAPPAAESPPPAKEPPIKLECKEDVVTGSRIPRRVCATNKRDESVETRKPDEPQPEAGGNQYNLGGR